MYGIHIFKGGIIISCQLEVMDMCLNPMTKILGLPVTESQGKMEFSSHNSRCWERENLDEWWVAHSNGQMDTQLREHTWIKSHLPNQCHCHLLHSENEWNWGDFCPLGIWKTQAQLTTKAGKSSLTNLFSNYKFIYKLPPSLKVRERPELCLSVH